MTQILNYKCKFQNIEENDYYTMIILISPPFNLPEEKRSKEQLKEILDLLLRDHIPKDFKAEGFQPEEKPVENCASILEETLSHRK